MVGSFEWLSITLVCAILYIFSTDASIVCANVNDEHCYNSRWEYIPQDQLHSKLISGRRIPDVNEYNKQLASSDQYYIYCQANAWHESQVPIFWHVPEGERLHDHIAFYRIVPEGAFLNRLVRLTLEEKEDNEGIIKVSFDDWDRKYMITLESETNVILAHSSNNLTIYEYREPTITRPWIMLIPVALLVCLSGLFSGLTLGLLSLDKIQLQVLIESGSEKTKKYASAILPLRKRGNWLLCTLLLGNVMVNSALAIISADLFSGTLGFVLSTALIVVFGEIIPQAICARKGLMIGYYTRFLVIIFMILLSPIAFPMSFVLDMVLGQEIGQTFSRSEMKELIRKHARGQYGDFNVDETKILAGAIDLHEKTVSKIMTPMEDVFMLEVDTKMNSEVIAELLERGHSRIPVYEGEKNNILGLMFMKDFALINPEHSVSVRSLIQYYGRPVHKVFADDNLGDVMNQFKQGGFHLAIVHQVNDINPDLDPFYENVGLVTMEDILEELIQDEIVDEYDEYVDMRGVHMKQHSTRAIQEKKVDYEGVKQVFYGTASVSKQQISLLVQFLAKNVEPFGEKSLDPGVLGELLNHFVKTVIIRGVADNEQRTFYKRGGLYSHFSILLQGKCDIWCGSESFLCNGGPFTYFGLDVLQKKGKYVCDFTATATSDCILIQITRDAYDMAVRSTHVEMRQRIKERKETDLEKTALLTAVEMEGKTNANNGDDDDDEEIIVEDLSMGAEI